MPSPLELDPATTVPLWQLFAVGEGQDDPAGWGRERAADWRQLVGGSAEDAERVARFFTAMVHAPALDDFTWRAVHLLSPDFGATVFDLALVEDLPDLGPLLGLDEEPDLAARVEDFEHGGLRGQMCVEFIREGTETDQSRAISATVSAAVPRDVPPYGRCVVFARCSSRHLNALMSSLIPLQHLLTSEDLLELVSGPA